MSQSHRFEALTNFCLETPWRYVDNLSVTDLDEEFIQVLISDLPCESRHLLELASSTATTDRYWAALVTWHGMPVIPLGLQLHGHQVTNSSPDGYLVDVHGRQICRYFRLPSDDNSRAAVLYGVTPKD